MKNKMILCVLMLSVFALSGCGKAMSSVEIKTQIGSGSKTTESIVRTVSGNSVDEEWNIDNQDVKELSITRIDDNMYRYDNKYYSVTCSDLITIDEESPERVHFNYNSDSYIIVTCVDSSQESYNEICNEYATEDPYYKKEVNKYDTTFGEQEIPCTIFTYNIEDDYYQVDVIPIDELGKTFVIEAVAKITDDESDEVYEQDAAFLDVFNTLQFKIMD